MTQERRSQVLPIPKQDAEAYRLLAWALSDDPKASVSQCVKIVALAYNTFKTQEGCELLAFAPARDVAVTFIQLLPEERRDLAMAALLSNKALAAEKLAQVERVQREARRILEEIYRARKLRPLSGGRCEAAWKALSGGRAVLSRVA